MVSLLKSLAGVATSFEIGSCVLKGGLSRGVGW